MITFDDEMNKLLPERRAKIEAKTQELLQEMQIIDELRQRLETSSNDYPETQNQLSFSLSKSDYLQEYLTLEKLTHIVHELGGEWELTLDISRNCSFARGIMANIPSKRENIALIDC